MKNDSIKQMLLSPLFLKIFTLATNTIFSDQFKTNEDFLGAVYTFVNQRQGLKYKKEVNFNKEGTNITVSVILQVVTDSAAAFGGL